MLAHMENTLWSGGIVKPVLAGRALISCRGRQLRRRDTWIQLELAVCGLALAANAKPQAAIQRDCTGSHRAAMLQERGAISRARARFLFDTPCA
jgi:hypothetical protein